MKNLFSILFGVSFASCATSHASKVIINKSHLISSDEIGSVWEGSVSGYYEHGYQFSIYPDKKRKEECLSGRFLTADAQAGKVDKFSKFDGQWITVIGRIEDSWVMIGEGVDYVTNVENYCQSDLVIVATDLLK